jgi:hypothetical protein
MDRVHRDAVKTEERVALRFGGRTTAASGSGVWDKGDVYTDDEIFEVKYTTRKSYSLKPTELRQLETYGYIKSKRPVFYISFSGVSDYVVLDAAEYQQMRALIDSLQSALEQYELWYSS